MRLESLIYFVKENLVICLAILDDECLADRSTITGIVLLCLHLKTTSLGWNPKNYREEMI